MSKMKKALGLVLALTLVFTMATSAMSASAFSYKFGDGAKAAKSAVSTVWDAIVGGNKKTDDTTTTTEPTTAADTKDDTKTEEKQPLIGFHISYDVVRNLDWGFSFGKVPETTTKKAEEPTVADETTTAPAATTEEDKDIDVITTAAPQGAMNLVATEAPKAAVATETVANTGDAGLSAVIALSVVSAAAFVVAKKK